MQMPPQQTTVKGYVSYSHQRPKRYSYYTVENINQGLLRIEMEGFHNPLCSVSKGVRGQWSSGQGEQQTTTPPIFSISSAPSAKTDVPAASAHFYPCTRGKMCACIFTRIRPFPFLSVAVKDSCCCCWCWYWCCCCLLGTKDVRLASRTFSRLHPLRQ